MTGLRADELAGFRQTQTDHLAAGPRYLVRRATTSDGAGGKLRTWEELPDPVPARLGLPTDAEAKILVDRFGVAARWTVTVPQGTDVQLFDRIDFDGQTVELVGHLSPWSWETAGRYAAVDAEPDADQQPAAP